MIYLSAQPDEFFYVWQIELLIHNLHGLGVGGDHIHILVGYNPKRGLSSDFRDLIKRKNKLASFFAYPYSFENDTYPPSIRPYLIYTHLSHFPLLCSKAFFYHDSDVIFRSLPDFEKMLEGDTWFVSDTRSYISPRHIVSVGGQTLLEKMAGIVGISAGTVIENEENSGGAQYLLKNTSVEFWKKIERDSIRLYEFLCDYKENVLQNVKGPSIQPWCADMWAILWNAFNRNTKVSIHPELDFCWPDTNINNRSKILHYTGNFPDDQFRFFRKRKYKFYDPYYDPDLESIDPSTCSSLVVNLMKEVAKDFRSKRSNLLDVSFLIPVRIDSDDRLQNIYIVTSYLDRYFDTNIIVVESDSTQKIDEKRLPGCVKYIFQKNAAKAFHRTRINNLMIDAATTSIISLYDSDVIIPVKQITNSVNQIRRKSVDIVSPYCGNFRQTDSLFKSLFGKTLDSHLLVANKGKFQCISETSLGGAIFMDKNKYVSVGQENQYISSWGPDDLERVNRSIILGLRFGRANGELFHLPHSREINSRYKSKRAMEVLMNEFAKVSSMGKRELRKYVDTWPWKKSFSKLLPKVQS